MVSITSNKMLFLFIISSLFLPHPVQAHVRTRMHAQVHVNTVARTDVHMQVRKNTPTHTFAQSREPVAARDFLFSTSAKNYSRPAPSLVKCVPAFFPGGKEVGRVVEHIHNLAEGKHKSLCLSNLQGNF